MNIHNCKGNPQPKGVITKIYMFEGEEYIQDGEERHVNVGEIYYDLNLSRPEKAKFSLNLKRKILIPKEESKMKPKYEILKPITPDAIWKAGNKSCSDFCREYNYFTNWLQLAGLTFDYKLTETDIRDIANGNVPKGDTDSWIEFLLDHELIKKTEEEGYSIGTHFQHKPEGKEYILADTGVGVCLISTSGNRWTEPIKLANWDGLQIRKVTQSEFDRITVGDTKDFKPIIGICPFDHVFGVDCGHYDNCGACRKWDACAEYADEA